MSEPEVVTTQAETVAFITMRGAYSTTPEGLGKLYQWIGEHGLHPVGMPTAVYFTPPSEDAFHNVWELRAPVTGGGAEVPPDSTGIGIKRIEPMLAVSIMHKGPYDTIAPVYERLGQWIPDNGYAPAGPPMERYYSDPATVPSEEYLTEVLMPVSRAHASS